ncbi:MAG: NAD(P)H-dependent oxidoreductase subunit E, partial [Chloroflexi bacterium]|nr:NAD(P)H-dependent oxidoreductase subunit E [Chloroflexota bacterium]
MSRLGSALELKQLRDTIRSERRRDNPLVSVCGGTGCHAYKCQAVVNAFRKEINQQGLNRRIELKVTGCHGLCQRGPLVVVHPAETFYQRVAASDVPEIVSETILKGNIIDRLVYVDPVTGQKASSEKDVPFYKKQRRLIFGSNGLIDPTSIDDYIAIGGYSALSKVLFEMTPEGVLLELRKSGLRGRGGAGFSTVKKWEACRDASAWDGIRYVICNADEGDPGAYMDRSLLEGNPHSVMEGMIIGAHTIGSNHGYVYVRHEYPLAVTNLTVALQQAREYGLLGDNILGSGFSFDVKISRGGGAFICGESTALMASLEGRIG